MIDEYEKVFKGKISDDDCDADRKSDNSTLLSLMDGTFKSTYRKVFILTTNNTWINDNMLNRPGRIRYRKDFYDLNREQINEIVDDMLKYKGRKEALINFMKPLKIITVDIVKAIVTEVNIYNEDPEVCCKHLNVEFKDEKYNILQIVGEKSLLLHEGVELNQVTRFTGNKSAWQNSTLYVAGCCYKNKSKPDFENMIFDVKDVYDTKTKRSIKIKFEKAKIIHSSFVF